MSSETEWFTEKQNGKIQINSITIYKDLSSELVQKIEGNLSAREIVKWLREKTIEYFKIKYGKNPEVGALNNAAGRWNELIATSLLSEILLDMNQQTNSCMAIFRLPNFQLQTEETGEVSSKFLSLFSRNEFNSGSSLAKIAPFRNQVFLPSPDYVIVRVSNLNLLKSSILGLLKQQAIAPDSLMIYEFLKGKIQVEEVKAVASLKTSNRPDRRYQPLFEAAMIKAMSYALEQNWQYYMISSELTSADRAIFSTAISPHGIALEKHLNLVDGAYLYTRKQDLVPLVEAAFGAELMEQ